MATVEENKNVVRCWVEARNCNDLQAALDCWSENWQERVKAGFTGMTPIFPDIHITIEDMIGEGDKVVVYATMHGTHSGPFMNIDATGRTVAIPGMDIYTVAHGKLQSIVRVMDRLEAAEQLGVSIEWLGKPVC